MSDEGRGEGVLMTGKGHMLDREENMPERKGDCTRERRKARKRGED